MKLFTSYTRISTCNVVEQFQFIRETTTFCSDRVLSGREYTHFTLHHHWITDTYTSQYPITWPLTHHHHHHHRHHCFFVACTFLPLLSHTFVVHHILLLIIITLFIGWIRRSMLDGPSRRWYTAALDSLWWCRLSSGSTKTGHVAFIQQSNPSKKVGFPTIGSVHTV